MLLSLMVEANRMVGRMINRAEAAEAVMTLVTTLAHALEGTRRRPAGPSRRKSNRLSKLLY